MVEETPTFTDFELFVDGSISEADLGHQVDKHNLAENYPKVQVRRVVQGGVTASSLDVASSSEGSHPAAILLRCQKGSGRQAR